ncbi:predicted protein [Naegleria gruberi]|uniref:Predicted protein n=1 Tax=Naegleria gruberi TaxID=5762 RepID=D2VBB8_NAEGR|nr:uncharacterized protein NAEGRDRAFT_66159 [Naegleria gruberi]EFC45881.1 predicted protein [Naegleria gruberi]|eukprot:XP_002678625.1 predicted protein [Naegleria gruberi strain NEG-M]
MLSDFQDSVIQYNIVPQVTAITIKTNLTEAKYQFAKGIAQFSMYLDHKLRCNCRLETTDTAKTTCINNYSDFDVKSSTTACAVCKGAVQYLKALRTVDSTMRCSDSMKDICSPFNDGLHSVGLACRLSTKSLCGITLMEQMVDSQSISEFCSGHSYC